MASPPAPLHYAPFYCEENIWQLCRARREQGLSGQVVLIGNANGSCALWSQNAAPPGEPVAWDYHVILLAPAEAQPSTWMVWDLDTRLGMPVALVDYLEGTFAPPGALPARFESHFLAIPMDEYLESFSSDRSHMRTREGVYRKAPPPWPPILVAGRPHFLAWLDALPERWVTLAQLAAWAP